MSVSTLAKKLLVKPGYRLLVLNAPPDFVKALKPLRPAEKVGKARK